MKQFATLENICYNPKKGGAKVEKFLFGVSTSAPQIEGAYNQDGKGLTIWDYYSEQNLIKHGHTCFTTCDSYNRLEEDLQNIKDLGINAYRFSISWARIQPKGYGEINSKGIDYYNRLIDGLLAIGVEPMITLFHWDLPLELDKMGGFSNREIVKRFEEYGKIVAENFSDRVKLFSVLNEPAALVDFLYEWPVGMGYPKKSKEEGFIAMHNILLCNAAATYALKKYAKGNIKVGLVTSTYIKVPKDPSLEDFARDIMFRPERTYYNGNTPFWDPVMFGRYNEDLVKQYDLDLSIIQDGDMEFINCKADFMGMNIYCGRKVEPDGKGGFISTPPSLNTAYGDAGGDVVGTAECMYYGPKFMYERYKLPIYITETGLCLHEWKTLDGKIHDDMRSDYLKRYMPYMMKAIEEGIDIRGMFVWSLLDNFEWSDGFARRFGLIYVDFETLERTKKQSYFIYKKLIKQYSNDILNVRRDKNK